jgi:hypothetical protein
MLLGVMDGHGTSGHLVSAYLAQHLPAVLMQKLVAAAATAVNSSGSGERQPKQRRLFGRGSKQQQQQQEQGATPLFAQVPYIVVPDHWPKYGFVPAPDASHDSSSSSGVASNAPHKPAGRPIGKHQVVQQPLSHEIHDLDADSSSSSSSGSSSGSVDRASSYSCSSSQGWLDLSHESVGQVVLSQQLLAAAFTVTDSQLSGSGINVVDRWAISGCGCTLDPLAGPQCVVTHGMHADLSLVMYHVSKGNLTWVSSCV